MKERILFLFMFFSAIVMIIARIQSPVEKIESERQEPFENDWFIRQRAFPYDEIPNAERLKSIEYAKQMPVSALALVSPWVLAGPTNIEGRIATIVINPTNPQIVYVGAADGGIWKSTNFCQSWVSVFDNENTSSIGSLAIDPVNPNIVYCGTGEANASRSYYPGTGMYKTTDGGTTWTYIGLDSTYSIGNILINPLNTQEIYAASPGSTRRKNIQRGLYKSTNGGNLWNLVLFHSDSVGAIDAALDPGNPSKIFTAMWERQRREDYVKYGGPMSALYMSTNSGANWSIVNGGFPSNASDLGRTSLSIASSNTQIIYALTAYVNGNSRGLYKTTDGGTSWTLINASVAGSSNYAWYNRICKVSPTDPNNLYCGGLNMEHSTSGGTSFSGIGVSHVDEHALAFAPSNTSFIVAGNDGGIDYSSNGGSSWQPTNMLPITQFYAGDIDYNNPNVILGGAQDNGTPRTLTGNQNDWTDISGGDGFYCLVDYSTSQRVYVSTQNGALERSTNGGSSFLGGTSGLDLTYTNWMTPYVMDKTTPLTLYCGTYKIHKTINGMQSWTIISPDLANGHVQNLGTITTVDVSKSNANVIYCGTDDANVWVTTNGGGAWTKINSGLPYRWVTRVAIHPDSANVCYVTLSGYKVDSTGANIFRTSNYGSSWISISGNLPNAPINDVVIDPVQTSSLYIATDVGVMVTSNYGASWSVLSPGIPTNVPCHDLTLHNPTRKLVVWTHGRSAFSMVLPPLGIINQNEIVKGFNLSQNYPNPFNPKTVISYQLIVNGYAILKIFDILGKEVSTLVNQKQQAGSYKVEWDAVNYPSGIYFYTLEARDYKLTRKMILIK
jgi:photosystem II stability/assembly factor-like uncharacterized protein